MTSRLQMSLGTWLLCLVCVSSPAWGSDGGDPEPAEQEEVLAELAWEMGSGGKAWKEPCAFAPGGELWRVSATSSGWHMSGGIELFALRREGQTVLRFGQEGPAEFGGGAQVDEDERWQVRCKPGQVDIVTPAIQVSLQAGDSGLALDPRFSRMLKPESREPAAPAALALEEVLDALASGMDADSQRASGLREALIRARLLNAERALAASNLDEARFTLDQVPAEDSFPELSSWASSVTRRLETLRSKSPLMATGARRVGALLSTPGPLHEDDPVLFWRGTSLCVRQEDTTPPRMRCVDARTGRWGKQEPYRTPFGEGWHIEFENRGGAGAFQKVWTVDADGERNDHGDWFSPIVVARGEGDRVAVVSAKDPREHGGVKEFDFASGPGSLLAGRGQYYFSASDELRSLKVEGLAWKFAVPGPQGELRCVTPPRVSPDGRQAACPVAQPGKPDAGSAPRFDLFVFKLVPR